MESKQSTSAQLPKPPIGLGYNSSEGIFFFFENQQTAEEARSKIFGKGGNVYPTTLLFNEKIQCWAIQIAVSEELKDTAADALSASSTKKYSEGAFDAPSGESAVSFDLSRSGPVLSAFGKLVFHKVCKWLEPKLPEGTYYARNATLYLKTSSLFTMGYVRTLPPLISALSKIVADLDKGWITVQGARMRVKDILETIIRGCELGHFSLEQNDVKNIEVAVEIILASQMYSNSENLYSQNASKSFMNLSNASKSFMHSSVALRISNSTEQKSEPPFPEKALARIKKLVNHTVITRQYSWNFGMRLIFTNGGEAYKAYNSLPAYMHDYVEYLGDTHCIQITPVTTEKAFGIVKGALGIHLFFPWDVSQESDCLDLFGGGIEIDDGTVKIFYSRSHIEKFEFFVQGYDVLDVYVKNFENKAKAYSDNLKLIPQPEEKTADQLKKANAEILCIAGQYSSIVVKEVACLLFTKGKKPYNPDHSEVSNYLRIQSSLRAHTAALPFPGYTTPITEPAAWAFVDFPPKVIKQITPNASDSSSTQNRLPVSGIIPSTKPVEWDRDRGVPLISSQPLFQHSKIGESVRDRFDESERSQVNANASVDSSRENRFGTRNSGDTNSQRRSTKESALVLPKTTRGHDGPIACMIITDAGWGEIEMDVYFYNSLNDQEINEIICQLPPGSASTKTVFGDKRILSLHSSPQSSFHIVSNALKQGVGLKSQDEAKNFCQLFNIPQKFQHKDNMVIVLFNEETENPKAEVLFNPPALARVYDSTNTTIRIYYLADGAKKIFNMMPPSIRGFMEVQQDDALQCAYLLIKSALSDQECGVWREQDKPYIEVRFPSWEVRKVFSLLSGFSLPTSTLDTSAVTFLYKDNMEECCTRNQTYLFQLLKKLTNEYTSTPANEDKKRQQQQDAIYSVFLQIKAGVENEEFNLQDNAIVEIAQKAKGHTNANPKNSTSAIPAVLSNAFPLSTKDSDFCEKMQDIINWKNNLVAAESYIAY
jgi:hypothetical protein